MAIFRVPRITTEQRLDLVLQEAEVVFDINKQIYYGGNGIIAGGFPIGTGVGASIPPERIEITQQNVIDKYVTLNAIPDFPSAVTLTMEDGIQQVYGVDFVINGNILSWDGLGLDNFIDDTDVLLIQYS
jgi:hypothetical protein